MPVKARVLVSPFLTLALECRMGDTEFVVEPALDLVLDVLDPVPGTSLDNDMAIECGGVFLHLDAKLNFHRLFEDAIAGSDMADVARRQRDAFVKAGVPLPEGTVS